MKNLNIFGLLICLVSSGVFADTDKSAKESQLMRMESMVMRLQDIIQQIQANTANIYQNNPGADLQAQMAAMLAEVKAMHAELHDVKTLLLNQALVFGSLDQESRSADDFNSVEDIDNGLLTVVEWLKTIYRQQLADKLLIS